MTNDKSTPKPAVAAEAAAAATAGAQLCYAVPSLEAHKTTKCLSLPGSKGEFISKLKMVSIFCSGVFSLGLTKIKICEYMRVPAG